MDAPNSLDLPPTTPAPTQGSDTDAPPGPASPPGADAPAFIPALAPAVAREPVDLRVALQGAVVMAPMTKGSNVPYRRLCDELGASLTMGEMAIATQLLKGRRGEFALIRRALGERFFGVQLAGSSPEAMAEAAKLCEDRGADLVDVNCGCPIDLMTRRGIGSALLRRPQKIAKIVEAMKAAVRIPVTVKIRLGWDDDGLNYIEVAKGAVAAGASAVAVHGRTRTQRYRKRASWEAVGEVAAAVDVPVIGNGDILFPHEIAEFRAKAGCAAVMVARGALMKPWIFREAKTGIVEDPTPEERLALYGRWVALAREHWNEAEERGRKRIREFLLWHLGFWCRYSPRRPDGSYPQMQEREDQFAPRSETEAMLWRNDAAAHQWIATLLLDGAEKAGPPPPAPETGAAEREVMPEG